MPPKPAKAKTRRGKVDKVAKMIERWIYYWDLMDGAPLTQTGIGRLRSLARRIVAGMGG